MLALEHTPGSAGKRKFRIGAPGFSVSIEADCPRALATLDRYLLSWLPREHGSDEAADICIVLRRASRADYFGIELNGVAAAASETMPYLFTLVQQIADDTMIRSLQREAVIHAGTVVYRGKAIVMPGQSGSGKSLLVRELLLQGAEYCSDEYAILDAGGFVHPYPRPLMIRRDAELQHPVLAAELGARVCDRPSRLALVLFLRFDPHADSLDVTPLDRSECLIRLLQNSPQVLADKFDVFDPIKQAAASAVSFAGRRGHAVRAAAEILRLAAETP